MKEGFGGDPYPSPDGSEWTSNYTTYKLPIVLFIRSSSHTIFSFQLIEYIVVLGRNGGKTIQIIEAGENGLASVS
jgi:hypothetical protein